MNNFKNASEYIVEDMSGYESCIDNRNLGNLVIMFSVKKIPEIKMPITSIHLATNKEISNRIGDARKNGYTFKSHDIISYSDNEIIVSMIFEK